MRGAQGVTSPLAGQMFFRMSLFSVFGGAKRWLGTNPDGSARQLTTADFFKARHQLHTCQPIARELQQCHDHLHATCRADDRPGPATPARLCPVWRRCCRLHRPRTAQATLCSQRSPNGGVTVAAGQCTASNYRRLHCAALLNLRAVHHPPSESAVMQHTASWEQAGRHMRRQRAAGARQLRWRQV